MNKKHFMMVALCLCLALVFVACGDNQAKAPAESQTQEEGKAPEAAAPAATPAAPGEEAGFDEFPLGDEQEHGPLVVSGVYFQPVVR